MDRKALFLTVAFCLTPVLACADPRDELLRALGQCAAIADERPRLACYDNLAAQVKAANQTPAPPQMAAAPSQALRGPPTQEQKESWFGLETLFGGSTAQTTPQQFGQQRVEKTPEEAKKAEKEEIDSITATLTEYAKTPFGKFIVFLDNAQVWRQIKGDSGQARFARDPKDNKVTISRALLGSYELRINDSARTYKVERMK